MSLFIASARFGRPAITIIHACLPFCTMLLARVLIIIYRADLSLAPTR